MGDRPTVGLRTLTPPIQVRILFPQPSPIVSKIARNESKSFPVVDAMPFGLLNRIRGLELQRKRAVDVVPEYTDRLDMCCKD